jgi:ribosomal protein S17
MPARKAVVQIKAPNMQVGEFTLVGTAPLVVHRISTKLKNEFKQKMETGKAASSRKIREAKLTDDLFNEARYRGPGGWDGVHAGAFRAALISACRLVGFTMTLAKLSIFVVADGWDTLEPQIPLVRIDADPVKQEDVARTSTGEPYICVRPAYHNWKITLRIRFDADQFTASDITNLLSRVGEQVGIGEGRPDSKKSAGMGWGLFTIEDRDAA